MKNGTISIKNWDEFQHYKDRNPPWIKFYHSLLDDYSYACLRDDSKLLLISLYLLAAKTGNKIPYDLKWIQSKAMLNKKIKLQPLLDAGFIYLNGFDSHEIAGCKQDDSLRREEKRERRGESEKREKFTPPILDDVLGYFKEKGYDLKIAKKAFEYYNTADWKDGNGKKVKNWKQKMIAVWMKDEHKVEKLVDAFD